jgi:hydroxymethylpyrimidine pyrophosphatase-like HAD family hydrolase
MGRCRRDNISDNWIPIRLLVFDIDGVLTHGGSRALDLRLLERLAAMNQAARQDPSNPAVTLCTGRPGPYAEAILRAMDGHLPGIFENGVGLCSPNGTPYVPHPAVGDRARLEAVRRRLQEALVQTGRAFLQPGKEYSLSLFPCNPAEKDTLHGEAVAALGPLGQSVSLVYSASCLNVLPRGMHKGKGVEFLAQETGYIPGEMLGVGDSNVDLPFLATVGASAAPANATLQVKRAVQYVAPRAAADGVRDILDHFGLML